MAALPNLLVIGAMKCGTSSLHDYLGLHPEIAMSASKELNFFLGEQPEPAVPVGPEGLALLRERSTAGRGISWYSSQLADAPVRGETSVAYSFPWYPGVARRAAAALGEARVIYLVRDPLERIGSHHAQFSHRDPRPLEQALREPGNPYLEASRYATAVEPFIEAFGRDSVLIVDAGSLLDEREATLAEVFRFLGVAADRIPAGTGRLRNVTASKGGAYALAERLRSTRPGAAVAARTPRRLRTAAERLLAGNPDRRRTAPISDPAVAREVLARLEPEIERIEWLTGWDLARWREPAAGP